MAAAGQGRTELRSTWPHRDAFPSLGRVAALFRAIGFPLTNGSRRSWWSTRDHAVKQRLRQFQETCNAAGVSCIEVTGELDEPTMSTAFFLLMNNPEAAAQLFEEE